MFKFFHHQNLTTSCTTVYWE